MRTLGPEVDALIEDGEKPPIPDGGVANLVQPDGTKAM
jgi:hypothetical protein